MSLQVLDEKINPLLGRKEVRVVIEHSGAGTPDRVTVRKMASDHYKTNMEQVYVRSIATRTGGSSAICMVEVYEKPQVKGKAVPTYIKNRNLPKSQRVSRSKKGEAASGPSPTPAPTPQKAAPAPAKPPEKASAPAKPAEKAPAKPAPEKPAAVEKSKK